MDDQSDKRRRWNPPQYGNQSGIGRLAPLGIAHDPDRDKDPDRDDEQIKQADGAEDTGKSAAADLRWSRAVVRGRARLCQQICGGEKQEW